MVNATLSTVTPPSTSRCSPLDWPTQWPDFPDVENNDPLLELKKIRYQAQVQVVVAQQAAIIERDKVARANDYSLHQALYSTYLDLAKVQLDRSLTRTQFIITAASAIATA